MHSGLSSKKSKSASSKKQDKPDFRGHSQRLRGHSKTKHHKRVAHEKAQKAWDDYYANRPNRRPKKRHVNIPGLRPFSPGHHIGPGKASIFKNCPAVPYLDRERLAHPPGGGKKECLRRARRQAGAQP